MALPRNRAFGNSGHGGELLVIPKRYERTGITRVEGVFTLKLDALTSVRSS
jgi:hypothetical protein